MGIIEKTLEKLDGYLLSIERDTVNGLYFIKVGLPINWVYESTEKINCEVLNEFSEALLIKVSPIVDSVGLDELIMFGKNIITVNEEIVKMEKEFNKEVELKKAKLISEINEFQNKMEDLKVKSFNDEEDDEKVEVEGDEKVEDRVNK